MSILTTSTLVTGTSEEVLVYVLCIYYLIEFQKNKDII